MSKNNQTEILLNKLKEINEQLLQYRLCYDEKNNRLIYNTLKNYYENKDFILKQKFFNVQTNENSKQNIQKSKGRNRF